MNIMIAVPTFETIYPDTYQSIYELDKAGHELAFEFIRGYDCATARNKIAQRSMDLNADYVLMVDNDVVLPKDALINLTDDMKEVCLGYYAHRDVDNVYKGRTSVCKLFDSNGEKYFNYPLDSEYTATELIGLQGKKHKIAIHGGGMGCAFISTSVFQRLKYPWYDRVNYADDNRGMLSEDLYFCEQCRKHGITIYTDTRVGCGHILRHCQWPE